MKIESFIKQAIESPTPKSSNFSILKIALGWPGWLILSSYILWTFYKGSIINETLYSIWILLTIFHIAFFSRNLKYGGIIQSLGIWLVLNGSIAILFIVYPDENIMGPSSKLIQMNFLYLISLQSLIFIAVVQKFFLGGFIYERALYQPKIIKKKYTKNGSDLAFSNKEYGRAAEVLKKFCSTSYESGTKKYGERIMDILILSGSIAYVGSKKKLTRFVSLKSIEEDRAAGPDDE